MSGKVKDVKLVAILREVCDQAIRREDFIFHVIDRIAEHQAMQQV
jgi:hypothetical protein